MPSSQVSIDLTNVPTLLVTLAGVIAAWGVLWRRLVRPTHRLISAMHDIVARELTPNGGSSMKDTTTKAANAVGVAVVEAKQAAQSSAALASEVAAIRESQETIFELFDNLVNRKGEEHDEMWDAFKMLGVERRHGLRREEDRIIYKEGN